MALPVTRYGAQRRGAHRLAVAGRWSARPDLHPRLGFARRGELALPRGGLVPPHALAQGCRLLVFDKRGTGLSDPMPRASTMEERMDDVRAVLDAAAVRRAVVFGASEGVSLAILFAATYPERTLGLVAYGGFACRRRTPDYPWAPSDKASARLMELVQRSWGGPMELDTLTPSRANDHRFVMRFASYLRQSASPGAAAALLRYNTDVDSSGRARARGCAGAGAAPHR